MKANAIYVYNECANGGKCLQTELKTTTISG